MKTLLKAIFNQLNTLPAIKWVDEDFGQLENYETRPAVQFPCALVSASYVQAHQGGSSYERSSTITIRIAHDRTGDRSAKSGAEAIDRTLAKLDDVEAVISCLTDFSSADACSNLYFTGMVMERRADGISVKTLSFTDASDAEI